jgi:hypothetical protein
LGGGSSFAKQAHEAMYTKHAEDEIALDKTIALYTKVRGIMEEGTEEVHRKELRIAVDYVKHQRKTYELTGQVSPMIPIAPLAHAPTAVAHINTMAVCEMNIEDITGQKVK